MSRLTKILFLVVSLASVSCQELPDYLLGDDIVARVGRQMLTKEDIAEVLPSGVKGADSISYVKNYVDKWLIRQLKIQEANVLFPDTEQDVEKLVEEYRRSLLTSRVDQYYIEQQMNPVVSDEDIAEYYNSHKVDFILDRTLVKGRVLRFDVAFRQSKQLKTTMQKALTSAVEEKSLADVCAKNDFLLLDNRSSWMNFSDFLDNLPVTASQDNEPLLDKMGVQDMKAGKYCYYFDFTSVCRKGNVAPLEIVADNIRRILLTRRRAEIIRQHEEYILESAIVDGSARRFDVKQNDEDVSKMN